MNYSFIFYIIYFINQVMLLFVLYFLLWWASPMNQLNPSPAVTLENYQYLDPSIHIHINISTSRISTSMYPLYMSIYDYFGNRHVDGTHSGYINNILNHPLLTISSFIKVTKHLLQFLRSIENYFTLLFWGAREIHEA